MTVSIIVETDVLKVTQALQLKAKRLSKVAADTAQDIGNRAFLDYIRTVSTWNERPKFTKETQVRGDTVTVLVGTDDKIYKFVDKGTRVRYATMTADFLAKTRPGVLGSRRGQGGVLFISKKHPRPGIVARRFTETIQERYDKMADEIAAKHVREWQAKA